MAKILGEAGRYTSDEARKKHRLFALSGILGLGCIGILIGLLCGKLMPIGTLNPAKVLVMEFILAAIALLGGKFFLGRLDKYERENQMMRKGADGEVRVGEALAELPDSFRVINGLSTPFGDLDHIVVRPSGVFIVDAKNWRGVVSSDGNGELLLNGKSTDKATIRPPIARTMGARDKVRTLCGFEPPFFKVFLAFTSARVEARWGTTGAADCVTDEKLNAKIEENTSGNALDEGQIDSIARAFMVLATMDKEFRR